jgi:protein-tyrosine phosphatase
MQEVEQPKAGPKQWLRSLIPGFLLKERDTFLRLGPKAGAIYAWYRLLDRMGLRPQKRERIPPSTKSVLFVCFGNIMRSPMAEAMFRQSTAGTHILISAVSAGLHAIPGGEAHPRALAASREIGLSLVEHRAKLLSPEMVSQADVIFVMDFQNKAEVLALYPDAREKVVMLSAYADGIDRCREIPDPYFGDLEATRRCYALLQTCIHNLTAELGAPSPDPVAPAST